MSLFDNMKLFVRVIELGNLSVAGRDLRVSPAVASHRLKELENYVGVRLFNRSTRRLQATEQGEIYYQGCLEVLSALEEAEAAVSALGGRPRGALRVTAPLGLGRQLIAPAIPKFTRLYPEIEVRLRLSDHLLDMMREGVDAAIRLAPLADSNLKMRKICDCRRVLCAVPAYLEARGISQEPGDLADHTCLLLRFPGSTQFQWVLSTPQGPQKVSAAGPFDADDAAVLTDWALAGCGIIMKPVFEIADQLRDGALVPVLLDYPPESATLAFLYPHRRLLAPKVKVFADYMIDICRQEITAALDGLSIEALAQGGKSQSRGRRKS